MHSTLLLLAVLAAQGPLARSDAAEPAPVPSRGPITEPTIQNCAVVLIDELEVPGREPGVLASLEAKEGMQVKAGASLGHSDDVEPTLQRKIKQAEHDAVKEQAESDIDIRFARTATETANNALARQEAANRKVPNSISAIEIDKTKLEAEKSRLQIEKAQVDQRVHGFNAQGKGAEVEAAEASIQRRQIKSPIDGVVTHVSRHVGEWVAPGDAILKIIRVNRLRVEGSLKASEYDAHEIEGRPVTVEVILARGRKIKIPGKIVFVDPEVNAVGEYRVSAEIANLQENHQWVLRPGLFAAMQIHLKNGG